MQLDTLVITAIGEGSQPTCTDLGLEASAKQLHQGCLLTALGAPEELGGPIRRPRQSPHNRALPYQALSYQLLNQQSISQS